jgi:hypothetical protein
MTYHVSMKQTVTFIPGMFSPFINTFLGTYFIDQMEYLDHKKIEYSIMPVHTEENISKNAAIIKKSVENQSNLIAFCHSKGGIDLLEALIKYPELRGKFHKIIFMQCPFFGTPLANIALTNQASSLLTRLLIGGLLGGDIHAISELTQLKRQTYMSEHRKEIDQILRDIDILCIGSSKQPEPGRFDSILKIPRDLMRFLFSSPNDGMVPTESALIPGAKKFIFNDLDHASAVIRLTPQNFDRKKFSQNIFEGSLL